ncbi:hypothetical protein FOA52_014734 [Chlamydomonas sp. UWO 241]|nr:hypothetical protein FOA52_014734 [Chlamydomonas sp. UWO 241]
MLRPLSQLHATVALCLALLSASIATGGVVVLAALLLSRHLTSLPPVQTTPLHFDYTHPVAAAAAAVDLNAAMRPFPRPMSVLVAKYLPVGGSRGGGAAGDADGGSSGSRRAPSKPLPLWQAQEKQGQQGECHGPAAYGGKAATCPPPPPLPPQPPPLKQQQQQQQQVQQSEPPQSRCWPAPGNSGGRLLLTPARGPGGLAGRLLTPGQRVNVDVTLILPSDYTDLLQLSGELRDAGGSLLARAARTHVPLTQLNMVSRLSALVRAPCVLLRVCVHPLSTVTVRLFDVYTEVEREPAALFCVQLSSRASLAGLLPPPPVVESSLTLAVVQHPLRAVLHWLRPGWATSLLIGACAVTASMAGTAAAMCLLVAAFCLRALGNAVAPATAPLALGSEVGDGDDGGGGGGGGGSVGRGGEERGGGEGGSDGFDFTAGYGDADVFGDGNGDGDWEPVEPVERRAHAGGEVGHVWM